MKENRFNNFILFWLSQSLSQLGSSMTSFALIIWVYKQTESPMLVSMMTFFTYLPYVLVSVFAGAFIDRHRKKYILLCTDMLAGVCTFGILLVHINGGLEIWHIWLVNGVIGLMNAFQSPANSVAMGIMVSEDYYESISGLRSFSDALLTVITPMAAAGVNAFWGLEGVIFIDLATFIMAVGVLKLFVAIPEKMIQRSIIRESLFKECKIGIAYFANHKGIRNLILSLAVLNFFSRLTYENILSPMILARSGGSDAVLGIVTGILGLGGVLGGLFITFKKIKGDAVKWIYVSGALSFLLGDMLMGLGQSCLWWCIAAMAASIPIPFITAGQNVIMYRTVPKAIQGRIFAVKNAVQYGTIPVGIILGGYLAEYVFEPLMKSDTPLALYLQKAVGEGAGSGMAVMFLCTGILGFLSSCFWYQNRYIQALHKSD